MPLLSFQSSCIRNGAFSLDTAPFFWGLSEWVIGNKLKASIQILLFQDTIICIDIEDHGSMAASLQSTVTCRAQSLSSFSKLKVSSHQCIPHFLSKKLPQYHSREQPGFLGPTYHINSNLPIFINILNDFVYHHTRFCYFYYFYSRISRLDF